MKIGIIAGFAFLGILVMTSCSWKRIIPLQIAGNESVEFTRRATSKLCSDSEHFIPWNGQEAVFPLRTIRLNFHFMNSRDSSKNLTGDVAARFARELVESANHDLANNQPMRLPLGNQTPVLDPLIRYEIVKKEDGTPAIYEHFDDENYYLVKRGRFRNNYKRIVIDRYGIGLDSILNVFVQAPPPDSMMGPDYGGLKTGVALRNAIRISGPLLEDARIYTYTGLFNHEVGHILGLRHSWVRDQCEDTPEHSNCWNFTNNGSECDSLVSNNIMDSNADQNALTPCQIGIIQHSLTVGSSNERRFQVDGYCLPRGLPPLTIQDTVEWCRETDVVSDIVIKKNSVLIVRNRVSMPAGSRIYLEGNGRLILQENAVIRNACGLLWDGVYARSGRKEQVVMEEGAGIYLD